jgi:hypothetical protein
MVSVSVILFFVCVVAAALLLANAKKEEGPISPLYVEYSLLIHSVTFKTGSFVLQKE